MAADDFVFLSEVLITASHSKQPPSQTFFCLVRRSFPTKEKSAVSLHSATWKMIARLSHKNTNTVDFKRVCETVKNNTFYLKSEAVTQRGGHINYPEESVWLIIGFLLRYGLVPIG